jgi:hypothetical protein
MCGESLLRFGKAAIVETHAVLDGQPPSKPAAASCSSSRAVSAWPAQPGYEEFFYVLEDEMTFENP